MRQFISSAAPDAKGLLSVIGKDYRYLSRVLRLVPGNMLEVRVPSGELVQMTVCAVNDAQKCITLQVCTSTEPAENITRGVAASEIPVRMLTTEYWLFQFIAKPQKMELIIRQAVECGVSVIVPVISEYSQKAGIDAVKHNGIKTERFERIIREARGQSGSPVATRINEAVSVSDAVKLWKENGADESIAVVLYERTDGTMSVHKAVAKSGSVKKAAVVIGCEGGISPQEIEILKDGGFIPVHFDGNILRCETAALYGTAALQSAIMERSVWEFRE